MPDSDSSRDDDSGGEEEANQNQTSSASTAPGIPFKQVCNLIRKAARDVENGKKPEKLDWKKIIPTLEVEASNGGFSMDLFVNLWTLLAPSPSAAKTTTKIINQTKRIQVVQLLVPNEPVDAKHCRRMINDVVLNVLRVTLADEAYKPVNYDFKFANAVMEQLFGLTEYNLTASGWMTADCFDDLFFLINVPEVCEWTCSLLRQTAHAGLVKKVHAEICIDNMKAVGCLRVKGLLMNLHFLYQMLKMLKPNLIPWDMHPMAFGNVRPRATSKKLHGRLYTVLLKRAEGEDVLQKGQGFANSQRIFKEFRPETLRFTKNMIMNNNTALSMNAAVWVLFEEGSTVLLNLRPDLLEMVDTFFRNVFRHRFLDCVPKLRTASARQQYSFILESCRKVCVVLQIQKKGLSSLGWWLPRFFITWDRVLWRKDVLNLVEFLNVGILEENVAKQALKILGSDVGGATETLESYQAWLALESLLFRWIESAPQYDVTESSSLNHHQAVGFLYNVMIKAAIDFVKDFVSKMERCCFVVIFLEFFAKLANMCHDRKINFLPMLPNSLFFAIFIADQFDAYESFCEYMDVMKVISLRADSAFKSNDLDKLAEFNEGFKKFFTEEDSPMLVLFNESISTMTPEDKDHFQKKIGGINYLGSPAMCPYLKPNKKWNIEKLKKNDAVHLAAFVHSLEVRAESTQQGPSVRPEVQKGGENAVGSPLRQFQKFTSTPMPKHNAKK